MIIFRFFFKIIGYIRVLFNEINNIGEILLREKDYEVVWDILDLVFYL